MNVCVLYGGFSAEREPSLASGQNVAQALRRLGHTVDLVDPAELADDTTALVEALGACAVRVTAADLVFPLLHGTGGEDGTLQRWLDVQGVRYVGSTPDACASTFDKRHAGSILTAAGLPVPVRYEVTASADAGVLSFPVVVKPARQGSSVGVSLVRSVHELDAAIEVARSFDASIVVERYVAGRELTVGILGDEPLAVGEVVLGELPLFTYEAKYGPRAATRAFPAAVSKAVSEEARRLALAAHRALGLRDLSRADLRLDDAGQLWLLEANVLPGMTQHSLYPRSAETVGIGFDALCERLCTAALNRG